MASKFVYLCSKKMDFLICPTAQWSNSQRSTGEKNSGMSYASTVSNKNTHLPVSEICHSMMSWNLTSKKFPTETEYGVWKLLSSSFTYQSQKSVSVAPVRKITKPRFQK